MNTIAPSEHRIEANEYGNVHIDDLPDPMPAGQMRMAKLPARRGRLEAAGVGIIRVLLGFEESRFGWKPLLGDYIVDTDWSAKLDEWKAGDGAAVIAEESRKAKERSATSSAKAARTRKLNKAAETDPYAAVLKPLREAQRASNAAKSKAANGLHRYDWGGPSGSYAVSRQAVRRAYAEKEAALRDAVAALPNSGLTWGWGRDAATVGATFVLYTELPTGQVSFHAPNRGQGPKYAGDWDGLVGVAEARIEAAIDDALNIERDPAVLAGVVEDAKVERDKQQPKAEQRRQHQVKKATRKAARRQAAGAEAPASHGIIERLGGNDQFRNRIHRAVKRGVPLDDAVREFGSIRQRQRYRALGDGRNATDAGLRAS